MTKEQHDLLLDQIEMLSCEEIDLLINERVRSLKISMKYLSKNDAYKLILRERKKELYFKSQVKREGEAIFCYIGLQALETVEAEFWFRGELSA